MSEPALYRLKIYCGQPFTTPFQYQIGGVVVDLTGWSLRAQARLVLLGAGLLASIDAAIATLPEPQRSAAQIEWEYSTSIERASPLLVGLADALGWPAETVDEIFRVGKAL